MIKFIINLLKVIFKKKVSFNTWKDTNDNVIQFKTPGKIKMIDEDVGVEKTEKGIIIHSFDRELSPEELINIIRNNLD